MPFDTSEPLTALLVFAAALLGGLVVGKLLAFLVVRLLRRLGLARAADTAAGRWLLARSPREAEDILGAVVFWTVLFVAVAAGLRAFGTNPVTAYLLGLGDLVPQLVGALVIGAVTVVIAAAVRDLVASTIGAAPYGATVARLAGGLVLVVGGFAALTEVGVAQHIVLGVFYALLALLVLPIVIAYGVAGIELAREHLRAVQARTRGSRDSSRSRVLENSDEAGLRVVGEDRRESDRSAS